MALQHAAHRHGATHGRSPVNTSVHAFRHACSPGPRLRRRHVSVVALGGPSGDVPGPAPKQPPGEGAPQDPQLQQQQPRTAAAPPASASHASQPAGGGTAAHAGALAVAGVIPPPVRSALAQTREWLDARIDPRIRGLILLNLMTLLMGSNYVVVKEAGATLDPFVFAALRFTLAAAAFVPFLRQGLKSPAVRNAGVEIGVWSALGYLTQSYALSCTDASRASLLGTFTVLAVPMLAGLSGEQIKPLVWVCSAMALGGTALLESGGGTPPNAGDAVSVLSALCFAFQIFRTEGLSRANSPRDILPLIAVSMLTTALVSSGGALAIHWHDIGEYTGQLHALLVTAVDAQQGGSADHAPLWQLAYTAWCSTDLALLVEVLALQSVTSTEAAMVYSVEPISGAALAYVVLGERWGPTGWLGAAIILAASLVTQFNGAVEEEDEDRAEAAEVDALRSLDAQAAALRSGASFDGASMDAAGSLGSLQSLDALSTLASGISLDGYASYDGGFASVDARDSGFGSLDAADAPLGVRRRRRRQRLHAFGPKA